MQETKLSTQRDYGVDLLRIGSMFMILVLHTLIKGGILVSTVPYSPTYYMAYLLNAAVFCAVNVYGLISGYVGASARWRPSNLLYLWLQVAFWSVGITAVYGLISPGSVSGWDLTKSFFPVLTKRYWYFTAYFALFLFMPALDHLIITLPKRQLTALIAVCVVLFSIVPTVLKEDVFYSLYGYGATWLITLYLIGGWCRRFEVLKKWRFWPSMGIFAACVVGSWGARSVLSKCQLYGYVNVLCQFVSPTMLLAAMALLAAFAGRSWRKPAVAVVKVLSPLAFGVYIIHIHPVIWEEFFLNRFAHYGAFGPVKLAGAVLLTAAALYAVFTAAEFLRYQLFRLLRIRQLCQKIDGWLLKKWGL